MASVRPVWKLLPKRVMASHGRYYRLVPGGKEEGTDDGLDEENVTTVPSVTTVLSLISKPFLEHWKRKVMLEAVDDTLRGWSVDEMVAGEARVVGVPDNRAAGPSYEASLQQDAMAMGASSVQQWQVHEAEGKQVEMHSAEEEQVEVEVLVDVDLQVDVEDDGWVAPTASVTGERAEEEQVLMLGGEDVGTMAGLAGTSSGMVHATVEELVGVVERASYAANDHRNTAAAFGTAAHDIIDEMVCNEVEEGGRDGAGLAADEETIDFFYGNHTEELRNVLKGFVQWRQEHAHWRFVYGDTMVYSEERGYAGAFDALVEDTRDNSLVVVDWKTSNSFHKEYSLQAAAYAQACRELGIDVHRAAIVRFDKRKPHAYTRMIEHDALHESTQAFNHCLALFDFVRGTPRKFVDEEE